MDYDFDRVVDRHGTGSLKYDFARERGHRPEQLPLWVADMDFQTPPAVRDALAQRAAHGIFGYSEPDDAYFRALTSWWETRHGWHIERSWCTITPGVVYALATAVCAYTNPGDAVLIQQPVYYPFTEVIEDNGRQVANAPLAYDRDAGRYRMDLDAFAKAIERTQAKLFLLCNPHNPVGRCWTKEELEAVGNMCLSHGVTIVSDEIHADFAWPGHHHVPLASISPQLANNCIVCTSASKSFNLAGLQVSTIVIPNPQLRQAFRRQNAAHGYSQANSLGLVATEAAHRAGADWLDALKRYLMGNLDVVRSGLAGTRLRLVEPESTYLVWIDCRDLGLSNKDLRTLVEDTAGLWLDMGDIFGPDGAGFIRVNIAAPRSVVREATDRLVAAAKNVRRG